MNKIQLKLLRTSESRSKYITLYFEHHLEHPFALKIFPGVS